MIESCRKVGFTSLSFYTSIGGNQLKLLGARFRAEEGSRHGEHLNKEHTECQKCLPLYPKLYILPGKIKARRLYVAHIASELQTADRRVRAGGWEKNIMYVSLVPLSLKATAGDRIFSQLNVTLYHHHCHHLPRVKPPETPEYYLTVQPKQTDGYKVQFQQRRFSSSRYSNYLLIGPNRENIISRSSSVVTGFSLQTNSTFSGGLTSASGKSPTCGIQIQTFIASA